MNHVVFFAETCSIYFPSCKFCGYVNIIEFPAAQDTYKRPFFDVPPSFSRSTTQVRRMLSSEASSASTSSGGGGSGAGIVQRLSSFFAGAGLCALTTQFFIYRELVLGNGRMLTKQKEIEKRLDKLEGK